MSAIEGISRRGLFGLQEQGDEERKKAHRPRLKARFERARCKDVEGERGCLSCSLEVAAPS